jgi:hypothetical protein
VTRRRTVLAGLALAVAVIAGCLDAIAPGAPRAFARLGIVPVFDGTANHDGIPADVDSIRVTIHHPPNPDIVVGQRIAPGQDSIVIAVEVPLANGVADTVTLGFDAIRSSDGASLYQGSQDIAVRVGLLAQSDSVHVRYVGPGQNLRSITITPSAVAVRPGDSVGFSVLAIDSTDGTVIGMPVLFQSRSAAVATVTQAGTARGVAEGRTYVVATSGARASVRDSALVVVSTVPAAVIGLAPTAVSFAGTQGGTSPAAQTIAVTNGGGGALSGLAIGTIGYSAGATGWLAAGISGTTAPATVTLTATLGSLVAGTYTATVPVTSSANGVTNSPQTVTVTFTVTAAPPGIVLTPTSRTFTATAGGSSPAAQTVAVANGGGGTLSGLAIGTITYGAGATGWLAAGIGGTTAPATVTLTATLGSLVAGTYTATVPVTSSASGVTNSPQTVTVTFTVSAALVTLASIQVTPGFAVLVAADTLRLQVAGKDGSGSPMTPTGVRFVSRAPGIVGVDSVTGLVTLFSAGTAVLVASATGTAGIVLDSMLVAVPASGQAVAYLTVNGRSFASARVGDTLRVVAGVDLRAVPGEKLGSYNAQLDWFPSVATFQSIGAVLVGGFVAPTVNTGNAASGQVRFGAADAAGATAQPVGLAAITLMAGASGWPALNFTLTDLSAAITFTNLLTRAPAALVVSGAVRVQ